MFDPDNIVVIHEPTYTLMLPSFTNEPDKVLEMGVPQGRVIERHRYWQEKNMTVKGDDRFWPPPIINVLRDGDAVHVAQTYEPHLEGAVAVGSDFAG